MQHFIALGRREALSVFGECYSFIRAHYWGSVRRELQIWISIAPCCGDIPWSTEVTAVDASTWGLRAVVSEFSAEEVRDLGKFSERWRFEIPEYRRPRASAFGSPLVNDTDEVQSYHWEQSPAEISKPRLAPLSVVEGKLLSEKFKPAHARTVDRESGMLWGDTSGRDRRACQYLRAELLYMQSSACCVEGLLLGNGV